MKYWMNTLVIAAMKAFIVFVFTMTDVLLYGKTYEAKISNNYHVFILFRWLFWKVKYNGKSILPVYRSLMFLFKVFMLFRFWVEMNTLNIGLFPMIVQMLSMLAAYFCMVQEFLYYPLNGQTDKLFLFEKNNQDTFWLRAGYFIGKYVFIVKPIPSPIKYGEMITDYGYRYKIFRDCFVAGCIIMFLTSFIHH